MKKVLAAGCITSIFLIACSKREPAKTDEIATVQPRYDTTAIDSFSIGATSVNIVRQIKMSSQKYQDSLKEAIKLQKEEDRITKEVEKENKKKQEEEKKQKAKNNASTSTLTTD